MFNNSSWKQLPKWSFLVAYDNPDRFKVLTNRSTLPDSVKRYHPWSEYEKIVELLRKTNLPIEEVPRYVTLAKKFKRKGVVSDLDIGILSKIPYWDILYEHQKKAVAYAIVDYKGRCYLADDMGTGKTFTAITILNYLMLQRPNQTALILCPASLYKNWKETVTEKLVCGNVDILSYDKAKNIAKELKKKYHLFIADEAHALKHPKTKRYKKLAGILKKIEFRILLSGTPTVNRANELYSPLSIMYPKIFKRYRHFNDRYFNMIARKCRLPQELSLILPLFGFVRRTKTQVLNLPEKKYKKISILVPNAAKDLETMMKKMLLEENASNPNYLKYLIGEAFHTLGCIKSKSPAVRALLKSLLQSREDGRGEHKVVFCFHKTMVESVSNICNDLHLSFDVINGETIPKKRGPIIQRFQNGELSVLICSINAAGVGITLTRSNHVIMAESSWVPGLNQQAVDRCHRIGQTKSVFIDRIHCLRSIDDFIVKCEESKTKMHTLLMRKAKESIK